MVFSRVPQYTNLRISPRRVAEASRQSYANGHVDRVSPMLCYVSRDVARHTRNERALQVATSQRLSVINNAHLVMKNTTVTQERSGAESWRRAEDENSKPRPKKNSFEPDRDARARLAILADAGQVFISEL